jgi:hypothetical protein
MCPWYLLHAVAAAAGTAPNAANSECVPAALQPYDLSTSSPGLYLSKVDTYINRGRVTAKNGTFK